MTKKSPWPFFFELNLIERQARRERTVFVTILVDGTTHWTDHSGRFTRRGGIGGFTFGPEGNVRHFRGDRELTPAEERAELREFSVKIKLSDEDFKPIKSLFEFLAESGLEPWNPSDAVAIHDLLERIYWNQVNHLMHEPFDPTDT